MYVISAAIDAISSSISTGQIPERTAQSAPKNLKEKIFLRRIIHRIFTTDNYRHPRSQCMMVNPGKKSG
jgi:hypothetical protein